MARWEPDPRGRLLEAALELFAEQGFEATTTTQLAARANLTKATVFRLFADKREILFQGQGASVQTVQDAVADAPADAGPLELVRAALGRLCDAHIPEQQEIGRRIDALLTASPELQERAAAKRSAITGALESALVLRGVEPTPAGALGDLGVRAYYDGFAAWVHDGAGMELRELMRERFDGLLAALVPVLRPYGR